LRRNGRHRAGQAGLEQFGAALLEIFIEQIHRPALERMKNAPGNGAKIAGQHNRPNSELIRLFST
jgi:hypothetical protein